MARFKRLTDAEARTLTRRELLDRVELEQKYWFRKKHRTAEEDEAFREFTRIMYAYLSPASVAEGMQDMIDHIKGRGPGGYWARRSGEEAPGLPPVDENQRAGLDYARRVFGIGEAGD
ncbi:MAG TPA: hypothetical protein VGH54_21710 [Mycobacterium sp.]|uniref:hypothetical protein n=1 Tax=Mycobacterium sp. TaxID=1785 RepID=UPI002F3FDD06